MIMTNLWGFAGGYRACAAQVLPPMAPSNRGIMLWVAARLTGRNILGRDREGGSSKGTGAGIMRFRAALFIHGS
jgi:hypothetical protein